MSRRSSNFSVNVDISNPGQFFACCGLLELAHRLWPSAEGWFERGMFHLRATESAASVEAIIDATCDGEVTADSHQIEIFGSDGRPVKDLNKILPLSVVFDGEIRIRLSWWLDEQLRKQSPFKMWSANGTSHHIFSTLLTETVALRNSIDCANPFASCTASSTRFGIDSSAGWQSLDVGFSPNEQKMKTYSSPVVELFASLGLQRFRPRLEPEEAREGKQAERARNASTPPQIRKRQDRFSYYSWPMPLTLAVAAAASSGCIAITTEGKHIFQIVSRGKFKTFTNAITNSGGLP